MDFGDPFLFLEFAEEVEEKDTHYASVMNKRKSAVSSLEVLVQAASKDPHEEGIANFVRDVLVNEAALNLSEHLYDILDGIGKGFSATEIEWDTNKRLAGDVWWVPKRLHWRDPRWFMFDWISGQSVLVRTLRTDGQIILSDEAESAKRRLEWAKGDGGQHLGNRIKDWSWNTAAAKIGIQPLDRAASSVQVHRPLRTRQVRSSDSLRSDAAHLVRLPVQELRAQRLVGVVERYGLPI